jgi:hypothetical protein
MITADMYMNVVGDGSNAALRSRPGQAQVPTLIDAPAAAPSPGAPTPDPSAAMGVVVPPVTTPDDPDQSPASAPPRPKTPEEDGKSDSDGDHTPPGNGSATNGEVKSKVSANGTG